MGRVEKTVFISYHRTSAPWALAIFKDLGRTFLVLLAPSTLDRCRDPEDLLRREVETALDTRRNIVPLMLESFDFTPAPPR